MSEVEGAITIEPESDAWRLAWERLARDVPFGDTSSFEIARAQYLRDGNGRRLLSVAFRHAGEDSTVPVFVNAAASAAAPVRRRRRRRWLPW